MKKVFIAMIALVVIGVIGITVYLTTRFQYNEEGTVGNTAGNLYNGGLFCEYEGKVYFSNPYDGNKLYMMSVSGENAEKLCDDVASYINVAGEYIYYRRSNIESSVNEIFNGVANGVFRLKMGDKVMQEIYRGVVENVTLYGNYLYYSSYDDSGIMLRKSKIDDTEHKEIMNKSYKMISSANGNFYFVENTGNHNMLRMDIETQVVTTHMTGNYYMPIATNSHIYFIDVANGYKLCRAIATAHMPNHNVEVLCSDRVVNYNVGVDENVIFYQVENEDDHKLMKMSLDGSNVEEVVKGDFFNISITSMYTYFVVKTVDGDVLYRVLTNGKDEPKVFKP